MLQGKEQKEIPQAPTVFGLLRHGRTLWNEEKRIQGSMDSGLSHHGRKSVRNWARLLARQQWDRIVASDLGRARATVAILEERLVLPVSFDSRLRELHWGEWEGKTYDDIRRNHPEEMEKQVGAGWDFRPPGGESRSEALQRARSAIVEAAARWSGQRILVVCHQGIIKCLILDILNSSFLPGAVPKLDSDALHTIVVDNGCLGCARLNITPSLLS